MTTAVIINQHTNNFGDDAAGAALATHLVDTLGADHVDLFYIWQKDGRGIQLDPALYTDHLIPELSGSRDIRASLAVSLALHIIFRRRLPGWLHTLVRTARRADFVYVSPAGANIGIYKDWTYLLVLLALVTNGVRPSFHMNTVGASNSRIFNFIARWVLRRCELNVRELASATWLASHGMSAYLGVDTAVLLADSLASDTTSGNTNDPYLAVVPTGLANWHRDFRSTDDGAIHAAVTEAATRAAAAHGLRVVLVPHLYGPEDESRLHEALRDELVAAGCRAEVAKVAFYTDYLDVLRGATVTLSMRYHGLVLSAISGVPCVAVAYENKMVEAAAYLGVANLCVDHTASADTLSTLLGAAVGMSTDYRAASPQRTSVLSAVALGPIRAAQSRERRDPSHEIG